MADDYVPVLPSSDDDDDDIAFAPQHKPQAATHTQPHNVQPPATNATRYASQPTSASRNEQTTYASNLPAADVVSSKQSAYGWNAGSDDEEDDERDDQQLDAVQQEQPEYNQDYDHDAAPPSATSPAYSPHPTAAAAPSASSPASDAGGSPQQMWLDEEYQQSEAEEMLDDERTADADAPSFDAVDTEPAIDAEAAALAERQLAEQQQRNAQLLMHLKEQDSVYESHILDTLRQCVADNVLTPSDAIQAIADAHVGIPSHINLLSQWMVEVDGSNASIAEDIIHDCAHQLFAEYFEPYKARDRTLAFEPDMIEAMDVLADDARWKQSISQMRALQSVPSGAAAKQLADQSALVTIEQACEDLKQSLTLAFTTSEQQFTSAVQRLKKLADTNEATRWLVKYALVELQQRAPELSNLAATLSELILSANTSDALLMQHIELFSISSDSVAITKRILPLIQSIRATPKPSAQAISTLHSLYTNPATRKQSLPYALLHDQRLVSQLVQASLTANGAALNHVASLLALSASVTLEDKHKTNVYTQRQPTLQRVLHLCRQCVVRQQPHLALFELAQHIHIPMVANYAVKWVEYLLTSNDDAVDVVFQQIYADKLALYTSLLADIVNQHSLIHSTVLATTRTVILQHCKQISDSSATVVKHFLSLLVHLITRSEHTSIRAVQMLHADLLSILDRSHVRHVLMQLNSSVAEPYSTEFETVYHKLLTDPVSKRAQSSVPVIKATPIIVKPREKPAAKRSNGKSEQPKKAIKLSKHDSDTEDDAADDGADDEMADFIERTGDTDDDDSDRESDRRSAKRAKKVASRSRPPSDARSTKPKRDRKEHTKETQYVAGVQTFDL